MFTGQIFPPTLQQPPPQFIVSVDHQLQPPWPCFPYGEPPPPAPYSGIQYTQEDHFHSAGGWASAADQRQQVQALPFTMTYPTVSAVPWSQTSGGVYQFQAPQQRPYFAENFYQQSMSGGNFSSVPQQMSMFVRAPRLTFGKGSNQRFLSTVGRPVRQSLRMKASGGGAQSSASRRFIEAKNDATSTEVDTISPQAWADQLPEPEASTDPVWVAIAKSRALLASMKPLMEAAQATIDRSKAIARMPLQEQSRDVVPVLSGSQPDVVASALSSFRIDTAGSSSMVQRPTLLARRRLPSKDRPVFTRAELIDLYEKAATYVNGPEHSFDVFYRNKPQTYWDEIIRGGYVMKKYMKDNNGSPYSPINGVIEGLFFNCKLHGGKLPMTSPFGEWRLAIPATSLLTAQTKLYFCDFYCNQQRGKLTSGFDAPHYVTIVATLRGSEVDDFCRNSLILLDPVANPFLCLRRDPNTLLEKFWVKTRVWTELFYTDNIDIRLGEFTQVQGRGQSKPGGLANNKFCTICNLYPLEPTASDVEEMRENEAAFNRKRKWDNANATPLGLPKRGRFEANSGYFPDPNYYAPTGVWDQRAAESCTHPPPTQQAGTSFGAWYDAQYWG